MSMKYFACTFVGTPCGWDIKSMDEDEIVDAVRKHSVRVHHEDLTEEAEENIRSLIREIGDE